MLRPRAVGAFISPIQLYCACKTFRNGIGIEWIVNGIGRLQTTTSVIYLNFLEIRLVIINNINNENNFRLVKDQCQKTLKVMPHNLDEVKAQAKTFQPVVETTLRSYFEDFKVQLADMSPVVEESKIK